MKPDVKSLRAVNERARPSDLSEGTVSEIGSPQQPIWIIQRTISGRWVVERPSTTMSVRFAERSEAVAYAYAESRRLGRGRIVMLPVRVRTRSYYSRRNDT